MNPTRDLPRALRIGWTGALAAAGIVGAIGLVVVIAPDLWLRLLFGPEDGAALAAVRANFRTVGQAYGFFALGPALYFSSQGAGGCSGPSPPACCV